jgi:Flp pilus assembly protein TadG
MVEFALILPIVCVVLIGVAQFGLTYNHYVSLTDAVRVGARAAAVNRASSPCTAARTAIQNSVGSAMWAILSQPGRITCTMPSLNIGDTFSISATYPFDIDIIGKVVKSGDLSSSASERFE